MPEAQPTTGARLERNPPRLLTPGAVLIVCAYGLLLMLPVLVSLLAVSVLPIGIITLLLPLLTMAATTFFLPFGFGNTYIRKLTSTVPGKDPESFLVQLTLTPRLHSGLRALIEDADDVGWLKVNDSALVFQGDALRFTVPFQQIAAVQKQSIGLRGLFVYPRLVLKVSGLGEVQALAVAERSSAVLPSARRTNRRLHERLARRIAEAHAG